MTPTECASRALRYRAMSVAPNATPRVRAIARYFTEVFDACREVYGWPIVDSYELAHGEALAEMNRLLHPGT